MVKIKLSNFTNHQGRHYGHAEARCRGHNYGEFGRTQASAAKKLRKTLRMVEREYKR